MPFPPVGSVSSVGLVWALAADGQDTPIKEDSFTSTRPPCWVTPELGTLWVNPTLGQHRLAHHTLGSWF